MDRRLIIAGLLLFGASASAGAQVTDSLEARKSILSEARYLKSIYKTDEAIEKLSTLVRPVAFDEEALSELADCHFQSGDYESAAGTYFLLSSRAPGNILYKIRQMQTYGRLKAWEQSIHAGQEALQLDSIPAVLSYVGDSFRQLELVDSALWYYRRSLARRPQNESVVAKAAGILIGKEDYDEAISLTGAFLAADPDNALVAPLQGLSFYRKEDYDAAIDIFQRQKDIGNDTYPIHYYLGQSYWHTKVLYEAEKELVAAWQIDSSDVIGLSKGMSNPGWTRQWRCCSPTRQQCPACISNMGWDTIGASEAGIWPLNITRRPIATIPSSYPLFPP